MATKAKTSAKKSTGKKPTASKRTKSAAVHEEYSQLTWVLMFVWLGLVAVFLAMIVVKLYLNN